MVDCSADCSVEWMVASTAVCWVALKVALKVVQSADLKVVLMADM